MYLWLNNIVHDFYFLKGPRQDLSWKFSNWTFTFFISRMFNMGIYNAPSKFHLKYWVTSRNHSDIFFVKQKIHKCILVDVSIRFCFLMMIILILNTLNLFILLAVFLFVNGIEILYCALFVNKNMTRAFICLPNNKFRSVFRL